MGEFAVPVEGEFAVPVEGEFAVPMEEVSTKDQITDEGN